MKKLFMLAAMLISISVSAQTSIIDTLTTASAVGTKTTHVTPANYFNQTSGIYGFGFVATKISGTVNCYAILQTSMNGTDFFPATRSAADSFLMTDVASQGRNWSYTGRAKAVRIYFTSPSSTQSVKLETGFVKN